MILARILTGKSSAKTRFFGIGIINEAGRRYIGMDVLTPEQRRRCMQANKSRGTKPELALGRLLWSCGVRYRKHPKDVAGRPDFCIKKYRLAIFVDGEFWHGRHWDERKKRLSHNRDFWIAKIERNMRRDREVTTRLEKCGWSVLRFWETEIKKQPGVCIAAVLQHIALACGQYAPQYVPMDYTEEYGDMPTAPLLAAEPDEPYGI